MQGGQGRSRIARGAGNKEPGGGRMAAKCSQGVKNPLGAAGILYPPGICSSLVVWGAQNPRIIQAGKNLREHRVHPANIKSNMGTWPLDLLELIWGSFEGRKSSVPGPRKGERGKGSAGKGREFSGKRVFLGREEGFDGKRR